MIGKNPIMMKSKKKIVPKKLQLKELRSNLKD
jgi:hypothetical protein